MRTDRTELEVLRLSVARIAQAVGGLCLPETPMRPAVPLDGLPFERLLSLAERDAGWNALCGAIIGEIERMKPYDDYPDPSDVEEMKYYAENI